MEKSIHTRDYAVVLRVLLEAAAGIGPHADGPRREDR